MAASVVPNFDPPNKKNKYTIHGQDITEGILEYRVRLKHTPLNHIDQERSHGPFPQVHKVSCQEVFSQCTIPHGGKREPKVHIWTHSMVGHFLRVPTLFLLYRNYRGIYGT